MASISFLELRENVPTVETTLRTITTIAFKAVLSYAYMGTPVVGDLFHVKLLNPANFYDSQHTTTGQQREVNK